MKTRDRIIESGLALFNQFGEPNVTTNHIAAELGISPGNLYYHFRNKEEIIHRIFDQYALKLSTGFQPDNGVISDQQRLLNYLDTVFQLMWQYRFFYANLPDILRRDELLQQKYLAAQWQLKQDLIALFSHFRALGWLALDDEGIATLCQSLKLVACCWIFYQSAQAPNAQITPYILHQGVLQLLNMVKPQATPAGQDVIAELIAVLAAANLPACSNGV